MPKSIDIVKHGVDSPAATGDDVFDVIHAVMHLFRAEQYRALRGGPHDLTHMDSKVLGYFARHPGATQSALAAKTGRDKGQLARLIAGLKARGLLTAVADEGDRRNIQLHLTADGRAIQQTLQRQGRRVSDLAVKGLSVEERQQLVALLDKVRANLENAA